MLVRNRIKDGGNWEASIYFGSRKYADVGEKTLIQYFIDKIAKITLPTVDGDDIEQYI